MAPGGSEHASQTYLLSGQIDSSLDAARRSRACAYASFAPLWIPFAIIVVAGVYLHYTGAM